MVKKLIEEITKKNAPVVAGLDPMLDYVPEGQKIQERYKELKKHLKSMERI